jgi:gliding motility-associated-like protein
LKKVIGIIFLFFIFFLANKAGATHNRAGEITYKHVEGFTYEITVRICVDASSDVNREHIPILWGDGSGQDSIPRFSGPEPVIGNPTIEENYYITEHDFNGAASYLMLVEDPNRNDDINNIVNSTISIFSITSLLVIPSDPSLGFSNNSVQMFNPPKGDACKGVLYHYNPLAFDPDGDSLVYQLVTPTGASGLPLENYILPDEWGENGIVENGPMTLDSNTGSLIWDVPETIGVNGEYNIAIKISEYRQGVLIGFTIRDMQITLFSLCSNEPPVIDPLVDTCIVAGSNLILTITATDPDNDDISIDVFGETFLLDVNPSTYNNGTTVFMWNSSCNNIRLSPYEVLIQAGDNSDQVELFDFASFDIQVIGPAVENIITTTAGNDIMVSWDSSSCDNATGYKIYRKFGMSTFVPEHCETGIPEEEGFQLIGNSVGLDNTLYVDEDVPFGNDICYRIVACFPDGSESIVSEESCSRIDLEVPVLVKVSIGETDINTGVDTISWISPLELDPDHFPPPYHYTLYHSDNGSYPNDPIFTTSPSNVLDQGVLTFVHSNINTEELTHRYRVEFYSDDEPLDSSYPSSSIFLTLTPSDNELALSWTADVGWTDNNFLIFRAEEGEAFEMIASTTNMEYQDLNLINRIEYCYYVVSEGFFDDPLIPFDIINFSQISCDQPLDLTPPCPPTLSQEGRCENQNLSLLWNNPNESCADDVTQYNLYYSPTHIDEFSLLETINSANITTYELDPENFVGCFLITALDSLFESSDGEFSQNESVVSDTLCIDGCPIYKLPNVITANGDFINDIFTPFPYRSIKDVDMKIYNRWGQIIFRTADPDINWTGLNQENGEILSDGVYYYVVDVNQTTLEGIVPVTLTGYVHLLENSVNNTE